jgi:hypothetical protein
MQRLCKNLNVAEIAGKVSKNHPTLVEKFCSAII